MLQVCELESSEGVPGLGGGDQGGFALWLTLLQNHEHKTQEMLLSFPSDSDRGRWISVVTPQSSQVSHIEENVKFNLDKVLKFRFRIFSPSNVLHSRLKERKFTKTGTAPR